MNQGTNKYKLDGILDLDALLGGIEKPQADQRTVTESFRFYVDEIEFDAQINKSPGQRRSWENSKRIGIEYFVEAVGDLPMRDLTREHGIAYRNWCANRIKVGDKNGKRHPLHSQSSYRQYEDLIPKLFQLYRTRGSP